eukprot:14850702-Ditylum_brightwellii.AAC.1
MEQLNVNVILRFHIPFVLMTLANLRGWCSWDSMVLGPFITKLMNLRPTDTMDPANELLNELNSNIVDNVCGGIFSRMEPFRRWITQMRVANELIMTEKEKVQTILSSVTAGIEAGYKLTKTVDWMVPDNVTMLKYVVQHIKLDPAKKRLRQYNGDRLVDEQTGILFTASLDRITEALRASSFNELMPAFDMLTKSNKMSKTTIDSMKENIIRTNGEAGTDMEINNNLSSEMISSLVSLLQQDLEQRQKLYLNDH